MFPSGDRTTPKCSALFEKRISWSLILIGLNGYVMLHTENQHPRFPGSASKVCVVVRKFNDQLQLLP